MRYLAACLIFFCLTPARAQLSVETVPLSPPPSISIIEGAQALGTSPNDLDVDQVTLISVPAFSVRVNGDTRRIAELVTARLREVADKMNEAKLSAASPAMAVFDQLSNASFRAEVMIPLSAKPNTLPPGLTFVMTPGGQAVRIVHRGTYDEIDATYEELSSFVEDRDIAVEDRVIERYIGDLTAGPNAGTIEVIVLKK